MSQQEHDETTNVLVYSFFGFIRGVAASLVIPIGLMIALRFNANWVKNVPWEDQMIYFGANFFLPAFVLIFYGLIAGRIAKRMIGSNWESIVQIAILTLGMLLLLFCYWLFNFHQRFLHIEHTALTIMALPNAAIASTITGQYVYKNTKTSNFNAMNENRGAR